MTRSQVAHTQDSKRRGRLAHLNFYMGMIGSRWAILEQSTRSRMKVAGRMQKHVISFDLRYRWRFDSAHLHSQNDPPCRGGFRFVLLEWRKQTALLSLGIEGFGDAFGSQTLWVNFL